MPKRTRRVAEAGPSRLTVPQESRQGLEHLGIVRNIHLWRATRRKASDDPGPIVHHLALLLGVTLRPLNPREVEECEAMALALKKQDNELGSLLLRRLRERTMGAN